MDKILYQFSENILQALSASTILSVDKLQNLWSDYGAIYRLKLQGGKVPSIVVKCISLEEKKDHPRAWVGKHSHQRKVKSYKVETQWYESYAKTLPKQVKVPQLLYSDKRETTQLLVMEDLALNYPILKQNCDFEEAKSVVQWLANFHVHFTNSSTNGLWEKGSYWHLDTRPDEWKAMKDSPLKRNAKKIDQILTQAKFQTIIHGDAKVANFCFGDKGQIAAVDFQYVGGGIGMKDLVYFIGSCFTSEECARYESKLLDCYFDTFRKENKNLTESELTALEAEWRQLFSVAWADFNRFLLGWSPEHKKLHAHAMSKTKEALKYIESHKA